MPNWSTTFRDRWALAATARIYVCQAVVYVGMVSLTDAEQRIDRFWRSAPGIGLVGGQTAELCVLEG